MPSFALSPEQEARRAAARAFADEHIRPAAAVVDAAAAGTADPPPFPWKVVEAGIRAGFTTMLIPRRYGGGGYDNVSAGLVLEELGAACAGFATVFGASILGTAPIVLLGSEEQKARLLGRIAGDTSGRFLCAFAVTEPAAGSGAASGHPRFGVRLRADRHGDVYRLTGTKCFISNGSVARLYSVLARTHPTKGALGGLSFFAVPAEAGVRVGRVERKLGQRVCHAAELRFEDVPVPAANLLGSEGTGSIGLTHTISMSTALVAAVCVGVARAAMELAREAVRAARPPAEAQAGAMRLFDLAVAVEAARYLTWRALWENDQRMDRATGRLRRSPSLKLSTMAKVFASDACVRAADDALEILAAEGGPRQAAAAKLARDAKLMQIFEGTNEIHRIGGARLV